MSYRPDPNLIATMAADGWTWDPGIGGGDGRFVQDGRLSITIAEAEDYLAIKARNVPTIVRPPASPIRPAHSR